MNTKSLNTEVDENTFAKEALQCEIGAKLKSAREEKNISTEFVIKELKFSKTFLNALETGEWSNLPGEVYALGFLKQYANLLELDINDDITRIKSKSFELTTPLTYPDAPISPNRKLMVAAVIIFIVLIIIVNFFLSDTDNTADITANNSTQIQQTDIEEAEPSPSLIDDQQTDPYSDEIAEQSVLMEDRYAQTIEKPIILKKTYSFYAATNDVWLQIYEDNGASPILLREVLLKKGQSFSIIDTTSKLLLTAGNARSLEILDGTNVLFSAGTLGKENKVLKLFPINP